MRMLKMADAVILSSGWTRRFIAFAAGATGALSMAPVGFTPAMVVTMVVAVWLLDGASERLSDSTSRWPRAGSLRLSFGAGWWLGFGYFLAGLWWLASAFLIQPDYAWALPLGVLGVPAILALFTGLGFVLARLLWSRGAARILTLALALGIAESARGHLFTGFPWNAFGMALGTHVLTAQPAALIGVEGLTLITVAIFAAPATIFDDAERGLVWVPTFVALCALAGCVGYGQLRLSRERPGDVPKVVIRIVQPGLPPDDQFTAENKDRIIAHYIELSKRADAAKHVALDDVTMLVWPESAFPFILTRDPEALSTIGASLPAGTTLVTGAAREEESPARSDGRRGYSRYYNSIEVIASGGTVIDSYDKIHLVPFGEYLPFESILRHLGLRRFVAIPGGFAPGHLRRALNIPGLPPAAPSVCYEAIFSDEVGLIPPSGPRPRFLLNVTDDGWFGLTAGPSQHFAQARLRTIEEGLPMIRAAATGISAIVDPYGRALASLPLGAEGIIDGPLPNSVGAPLFARGGNLVVLALWGLTLIFSFLMRFAQ